jgi:hypothetical protein
MITQLIEERKIYKEGRELKWFIKKRKKDPELSEISSPSGSTNSVSFLKEAPYLKNKVL